MKFSNSMITIKDPFSIASESYKMLRTNLRYVNIDRQNKIVVFTSALPEEGKTTSVLNTAISCAQDGLKVLVVDCDLRRALVHHHLKMSQKPGLIEFLVQDMPLSDVIKVSEDFPNLHVVTSGELPPNPSELLGTSKMKNFLDSVRDSYDFIFIDTPPVLSVVDSVVVARNCDSVALVVAAGCTKKDEIIRAKKQFDLVGVEIAGTVLTKAVLKNKGYYRYDKKKNGKNS